MITFFLLNGLAWLATACLLFLILFAIQPGHIFASWQNTLRELDLAGSGWYNLLGGCYLCTSQFMSLIVYPVFALFTFTTHLFPFGGWHVFTWALVYIPIGSVLNFLTLSKLLPKKEN